MARLTRVLAVGDLHFPFQDQRAIELMVDVVKDFKPDKCVFLGDVFDMYCISRFEKNPYKDFTLLRDELADAREQFRDLIDRINARTTVFIGGNHDLRLEKYVALHAPKLGGLFKTEEILGVPNGVLYLPYGQKNRYKIGKLIYTHGTRTGENPASSMVKKYRSSVLFGHTHKLQIHHITDIHHNDFVGISAGWLGNEQEAAEYISDVSDWTKGFVLTWHKENGDFFYQTVKINEGKSYECVFNGVLYQG